MNITEQERFRVVLSGMKEQILARKLKISSAIREIGENTFIDNQVLDESDKAEANCRMGVNVGLCEQISQDLTRIQAALDRIDQEIFGNCLRCEESISPARLEAMPYAIMCIYCQDELEKQSLVCKPVYNSVLDEAFQ